MNDQQTQANLRAGDTSKRYEDPQQLVMLEISMTAILLGMTGLLAWLWSL